MHGTATIGLIQQVPPEHEQHAPGLDQGSMLAISYGREAKMYFCAGFGSEGAHMPHCMKSYLSKVTSERAHMPHCMKSYLSMIAFECLTTRNS